MATMGPTKFVAKWTLIEQQLHMGLYKLTRYVLGEEEWNRIMNPEPKPIETQQANNNEVETIPQQNEAINQQESSSDDVSDEYSVGPLERWHCLVRGEGLDNTIRNERIALDARLNGGMAHVVYSNVSPREEGQQPTRLASKNGNIVRRDREDQYKAKWEAYKKEHYPAGFFS
jgi:hypothetical protein